MNKRLARVATTVAALFYILQLGITAQVVFEPLLKEVIVVAEPIDIPEPVMYEEAPEETVMYEVIEPDIEEEMFYDSLETMAYCVEAEAGNQGLMGKRLVVDVILNRVDSELFPDDIESVISQQNQFAVWSNGAMDRIVEPSEETFEAIRLELDERTDREILYFSAYAYNAYCDPAYQYKDHYFGYQKGAKDE